MAEPWQNSHEGTFQHAAEYTDERIQTTTGQTAAPSSTTTVDTVDLTSADTVEWLVLVRDISGNKHSFRLKFSRTSASKHVTEFARGGDSINYSADAVINGGNVELQITNGLGSPLSVKFSRVKI